MRTMFTFTTLDLLLPDGGSVLLPAQRSTSSKRVKISVKKPKKKLAFFEIT